MRPDFATRGRVTCVHSLIRQTVNCPLQGLVPSRSDIECRDRAAFAIGRRSCCPRRVRKVTSIQMDAASLMEIRNSLPFALQLTYKQLARASGHFFVHILTSAPKPPFKPPPLIHIFKVPNSHSYQANAYPQTDRYPHSHNFQSPEWDTYNDCHRMLPPASSPSSPPHRRTTSLFP